MPLIVKPNARRMQAFRDSPSAHGYMPQHRVTLVAPIKGRLPVIGVITIVLALSVPFLFL